MHLSASKLETELGKPEVDALIKGKLEQVMARGDQSTYQHYRNGVLSLETVLRFACAFCFCDERLLCDVGMKYGGYACCAVDFLLAPNMVCVLHGYVVFANIDRQCVHARCLCSRPDLDDGVHGVGWRGRPGRQSEADSDGLRQGADWAGACRHSLHAIGRIVYDYNRDVPLACPHAVVYLSGIKSVTRHTNSLILCAHTVEVYRCVCVQFVSRFDPRSIIDVRTVRTELDVLLTEKLEYLTAARVKRVCLSVRLSVCTGMPSTVSVSLCLYACDCICVHFRVHS